MCHLFGNVEFHMDTMCINGLPFLTSIVVPTCCGTCASMEGTNSKEHCQAIDKTFCMLNHAGLKVKTVEGDGRVSQHDGPS